MKAKSKKKRCFYAYLVECRDHTLYAGCTTDLKQRIKTHNSGKGAKYTRGRLPVRLCWYKLFDSLSLALREERRIKKLTRDQKQKMINYQN